MLNLGKAPLTGTFGANVMLGATAAGACTKCCCCGCWGSLKADKKAIFWLMVSSSEAWCRSRSRWLEKGGGGGVGRDELSPLAASLEQSSSSCDLERPRTDIGRWLEEPLELEAKEPKLTLDSRLEF